MNYKYWVKNRILAKSVATANGCIEYTGNPTHRYGLISITTKDSRRRVPPHRAIWMAENDKFDLPRNVVIRHKCDNPRCVNIDHLVSGTHQDNYNDMANRGRRAKKYKLHTRIRKLSDEEVIAIKRSTDLPSELCRIYKISNSYVSKLRRGRAKTLVV